MAKPPATPPSSDLQGVHRDRAAQNAPTTPAQADERDARMKDSPGQPNATDAGEGRGG